MSCRGFVFRIGERDGQKRKKHSRVCRVWTVMDFMVRIIILSISSVETRVPGKKPLQEELRVD
jgi:hypothetical protein